MRILFIWNNLMYSFERLDDIFKRPLHQLKYNDCWAKLPLSVNNIIITYYSHNKSIQHSLVYQIDDEINRKIIKRILERNNKSNVSISMTFENKSKFYCIRFIYVFSQNIYLKIDYISHLFLHFGFIFLFFVRLCNCSYNNF